MTTNQAERNEVYELCQYLPPGDDLDERDRRLEDHGVPDWDVASPAALDLVDVVARYTTAHDDPEEVLCTLAFPMCRAGLDEAQVVRLLQAAGLDVPPDAVDLVGYCLDHAPTGYRDVEALLTSDAAIDLYDCLDEGCLEAALRGILRATGQLPADLCGSEVACRLLAHDIVRPKLEALRRAKTRRGDSMAVTLGALLEGRAVAEPGRPRDRALRSILTSAAWVMPTWLPWGPLETVIAPSIVSTLRPGEAAEDVFRRAKVAYAQSWESRVLRQDECSRVMQAFIASGRAA